MGILCENSSIREYIKITLNKIENDLDLELQDRLMWNGPIYIYIYISQKPKGLKGGETLPLLIGFQM